VDKEKCPRCWKRIVDKITDPEHPQLCSFCVKALKEKGII